MGSSFRNRIARIAGIATITAVTASSPGQSLNVDINLSNSSPALGSGPPASSFGAAANQPGVWNTFDFGPSALVDLNGSATSVTLSITASSTTPSVLGFNNPSNTGDFALLMNDASQIGTVVQGGFRIYQFSGLLDGMYQVYTYASPPQPGNPGQTHINILNSVEGLQTASGAHAPNTFALGVTHVIHHVNVVGGMMTLEITDSPGSPAAYFSGIQLVIPGPGALGLLALSPLLGMHRRRRN